MATKNYKFRSPKGKVLLFNSNGKAVPVPAQTIADDLLLRSHFPPHHFCGLEREVLLASLRGESLKRFW